MTQIEQSMEKSLRTSEGRLSKTDNRIDELEHAKAIVQSWWKSWTELSTSY